MYTYLFGYQMPPMPFLHEMYFLRYLGLSFCVKVAPHVKVTLTFGTVIDFAICRGHWAHPRTLLEGVRGTPHLGTRESVLGRMRWLLRQSKRVREGLSNNNNNNFAMETTVCKFRKVDILSYPTEGRCIVRTINCRICVPIYLSSKCYLV